GPRRLAAGNLGDRRQRVPLEVAAHRLAGLLPDREQHALPLVIAGAVLMRLAEVAERDRPVHRRQDLGQSDLLGRAGEHVAAADAALGTYEPGTLERQQ